MKNVKINILTALGILSAVGCSYSCKPKNAAMLLVQMQLPKAYVAPGKYDEFYNFVSGGFSGQMSVYGLPSGRLLRVIPFFLLILKKDMDIVKKPNRC